MSTLIQTIKRQMAEDLDSGAWDPIGEDLALREAEEAEREARDDWESSR